MKQYAISKRGLELSEKLVHDGHFLPNQTDTVAMHLSRIMRMVPEHRRIQEALCSDDMGPIRQARCERRDAQIEKTMAAICAELPPSTKGLCALVFQGDPRGYTVKLKVPNSPRDGNTWGLDGEYGL